MEVVLTKPVLKDEVLFLGIDGGGSKCRARLVNANGEYLGGGLAGPANPVNGLEVTTEAIISATRQALDEAGCKTGTVGSVVAGVALAGVNVPRLWQVVSNWAHPFKRLFLTTDLHAACLGAHRGGDGAVIIAGTGSCGYASVGDRRLHLGAHGFLLGDKGGGAWVGLQAVKAVLLAADKLGPQTALSEAVLDVFHCSITELLERFSDAGSSEFAFLAPLVFDLAERGDQVANGIVDEGAAYISAMASELLTLDPPRLSLIGGVATRLLSRLNRDLLVRVSAPLAPPEEGSVYFAQNEYARAVGDGEALQA